MQNESSSHHGHKMVDIKSCHQMCQLKMVSLALFVCQFFVVPNTIAFSSGLTGYSGKQGQSCATSGCHSGANYNSQLRFDSATTVEPGSTNDLELVLSFTPNPANTSHYAGINVALSNNGGNLLPGSQTKLVDSELTHNSPIAASNNSVSWEFRWTAPSTEGNVTLYACSETVDRNFLHTGDESSPACLVQTIMVASAEPEPEPEPDPPTEPDPDPTPDPNPISTLVSLTADFNVDGNGDTLYRNTEDYTWTLVQIDDARVTNQSDVFGMTANPAFSFNGMGDFNGDGATDVLVSDSTKRWLIYNMSSENVTSQGFVSRESSTNETIKAVSDFNKDGFADVLHRNEGTGEWNLTLLKNRSVLDEIPLPMSRSSSWEIIAAKDFNGNGNTDVLIRNKSNGSWVIYFYSGSRINQAKPVQNITTDLNEVFQSVGDFNGDGIYDILLQNKESKSWSITYMNGWTPIETQPVFVSRLDSWKFESANDFNGDGYTDISIRNISNGLVFTYYLGSGGGVIRKAVVGSALDISLEALSNNPWLNVDNNDSEENGSGEDGGSNGDSGDESNNSEDYFNTNISTQVVQNRCIACHIEGGPAASSRLLFVRSDTNNFEEINNNAFRDFLAQEDVTESYIMSKVSGGLGHVGGAQLNVGSDDYNNLQTYLNMLSGNAGGNNGGDSDDFWQGVSLLEADLTLRKAALQFTGALPTDSQLASVDDNSTSALRSEALALMQGDGFHEFLLRGANDRLHTDKYLNRGAEALDSNGHYLPAFTNKAYEMRSADQDEELWQWQVQLQRGFARAPLELIAYVIENNRPYTEILTADYTMMTPFTNEAYKGDVSEFSDPNDENEFKPGKVHGVMLLTEDVQAEFSDDLGLYISREGPNVSIPHAGILNDPAWLNRYPSTTTNRNRARSRWTYFHFLDFDIEKSAQRTQNPDDLADTDNPTLNNPNCSVCHQTMDPIAGAYQNYGDFGWYRDSYGGRDSLSENYKWEEGSPYEEGDIWYRTMRTPGFEDKTAPNADNSLQWLANEIIQDPRFATAAVKFWWPALTGEIPLSAPQEASDPDYAALNEAYVAQSTFINRLSSQLIDHWDMKQIFADIIVSEWYRAHSNTGNTVSGQDYLVTGTEKLLGPEELDFKTKAITGYSWNERFPEWDNNRRHSGLLNDYRLSYGGIDSDGITERATEMTSMMSQVALAHASESACPIVVQDFAKPDTQRLLFTGITKSTTPGQIGSQDHSITGQWAQNQRDYDFEVTLSSGQHSATVSYTNDFYDNETGLNRDLAINRIQILGPQNQIIMEFEGNEVEEIGASATCGDTSWNEVEDTQNSSDWNLWGNCSISFPFTTATSGSHRIRVNAYYMEWDNEGAIDTPSNGAGPAQMSVIAEVADPINQSNPSAELIKQTIANLHFKFLGEKLNTNDDEVTRTFQLFVDSWNAKKQRSGWNHIAEQNVSCNFDFSQYDDPDNNQYGWTLVGEDPHSTMTAWKTVIAYLMTDYKYLHE